MAKGSREKADHFTLEAKKRGYPARSVFKLEEIDQKNRIIHPGQKVLDIGAAPGSWSLYVLRKQKGKGSLVAVDLKPLTLKVPKQANFTTLTGDAFGDKALELYEKEGPFDLIISDAAPGTTGNRSIDTARSFNLVMQVLELTRTRLNLGGSAVCKIFQGGDEKEALDTMRSMFAKAKTFKPKSTRNDSFETFLVGTGFKGSA